jgi:hypothetical protein
LVAPLLQQLLVVVPEMPLVVRAEEPTTELRMAVVLQGRVTAVELVVAEYALVHHRVGAAVAVAVRAQWELTPTWETTTEQVMVVRVQ